MARLVVVGPGTVVGHVAAYFRLGDLLAPGGARGIVCILAVVGGPASCLVVVLELDVLLGFRHGGRVVAI